MYNNNSRGRVFACACILLGLAGCTTLKDDYYFEPSVVDTAKGSPIPVTEKPAVEAGDLVISDRYILSFLNQVRHALRKRMTVSRIARILSSTTQLVSATAAAALGAAAGSGVAIAALASTSATVPEFAQIFQTGARAEAYHRGLSLIEAAESRYYASIATAPDPGKVSQTSLTREGAALYSEVVGSVNLVEKALLGLIPSLEEVKQAEGRLFENILSIESSSRVNLSVGESKTVTTRGAGPLIGAFSSDPKIAVASHADRSLSVEARGEGVATITLVNDHGARAFLEVEVAKPVPSGAPPVVPEVASVPSCEYSECSFLTELEREKLQRRLCADPDGVFGSRTRNAIREYQAAAGAESASGILSPDEATELAKLPECDRTQFLTYHEVFLSRTPGAISMFKKTLNDVAQGGHFKLAQPLLTSGTQSDVIDAATREAVKAFQSASGLAPTGAITRETADKLNSKPNDSGLSPDQ